MNDPSSLVVNHGIGDVEKEIVSMTSQVEIQRMLFVRPRYVSPLTPAVLRF